MLISRNHAQNNNKFQFLFIEDELLSQKSTELQLKLRFDCEVFSVCTGEEGVALANTQHFDLLIINIGLPGMNGFLVAKAIRQSSSVNKNTPIIATSGTLYSKEVYFEAGIDDFLVKPYANLELENIIKKFLLPE